MKRNIFISSLFSLFLILGAVVYPVSATVIPIAGNTYNLAGSGVSSSATSFTLQSFTIKQSGHAITDAEMSDTFYITLEPGSNTHQEIVSCTTVTQNSNGTATISGCTRGLSPLTPYTTSSSYKFSHAGGTQVIFSNVPQFYNLYAAKENNEAITGDWTVPTPTGGTSIANKNYVLSVVTGGTITTDQVTVVGTAGETVSAGQVVYLYTNDGRWYKASASSTLATTNALLGVAEGAGTAGVAITNGVLVHGTEKNQSGLTIGAPYFLSATAGSIQTATTTKTVGKAKSATELYFDPQFINTSPQIYFGIDAEVSDAYRITPVNVYATTTATYATGTIAYFRAATANTGTSTLNISGVGAKTITKAVNQNLTDGDIAANQIVGVQYDGTNWQMFTLSGKVGGMVRLGETTLTAVANTITVSNITSTAASSTAFRYLKVYFDAPTYSGNDNVIMRLNSDSTTDGYLGLYSTTTGSSALASSKIHQSSIEIGANDGSLTSPVSLNSVMDITNNARERKTIHGVSLMADQTYANNMGIERNIFSALWNNSVSQINSITISSTAGNFSASTTLTVYGSDNQL